jgi:hypothetical protein
MVAAAAVSGHVTDVRRLISTSGNAAQATPETAAAPA